MSVVIVDYGAGNLRSAAKAFETVAAPGLSIAISSDPRTILAAERVVLPGVGAFGDCMVGLNSRPGVTEALVESVLKLGRPFLGICVGMQLMASVGVEFGTTPGLDWIAGRVEPLRPDDPSLRIPQMGWNELQISEPRHPVFAGINDGDHAYFVHSFAFMARDRANVLAQVEYGGAVTAAIGRDNLFGVQFHPEKSQRVGLHLIANFLNWQP